MIVLTRNQAIGVADPHLSFFSVNERGAMLDPHSLAYQIEDPSGTIVVPTTVIPTDLASGQRVSMGRFAIPWNVPSNAAFGEWRVRWFWRTRVGDVERSYTQTFEVFSARPQGTIYGSPNGLRARVPSSGPNAVTDALMLRGMVLAAKLIERITRRFFEARYLVLDVDGRTPGSILLDIPVIAVANVNISAAFTYYWLWEHEGSAWIVYNRHLRGLTEPDDRDDPQLAFPVTWYRGEQHNRYTRGGAIPYGPQTVQIAGVFGYTEADGSPTGCTPIEIADIADRIALGGGYFGPRDMSWGVKSERTREQSIEFGNAGGTGNASQFVGAFTGDPAIDNVLAAYCAPIRIGSV